MRALFDLAVTREAIRIGLERAFSSHLGLRLRGDEARTAALKTAGRARSSWDPDEPALLVATTDSDEALLDGLAESLSRIAKRPLTARLVLAALDISNQERLRWTKDGRLPQSGTAYVRKGQLIACPLYDADLVARLMERPDIIRTWREADLPAP